MFEHPRPRRGRARRATAAFAASAVAFGGAVALLGPATSTASSHREAPLISNDPQADNTDLYSFVSPSRPDRVVFVANWQPFAEPAGGPNFFPFPTDARYNVHIDNDGDAKPDITYQWTFRSIDNRGLNTFLYNNGPVTDLADPNLLFRQRYTLTAVLEDGTRKLLVHGGPVAPSRVGDASMPDYRTLRNQAIVPVTGGGRSFVGQADDPFFLDLRVFDLLYGGAGFPETGDDTLAGFNVNSVVLEVPIAAVKKGTDPVIGVWTTTERRSLRVNNPNGSQTSSGGFVQVSRLGNPLVNEVVIPAGLKDAFNALKPQNDADVPAAVDRVLDPELARLIEAIHGIPAPATPRNDLFAVFLTGVEGLNKPANPNQRPAEMLRLNTSIKPDNTTPDNRLGVIAGDNQGFPNGRRLADDVVDIALQVVEGELVGSPNDLGDAVNRNDKAFSRLFPYVALPHSGSNATVHTAAAAATAAATAPGGPSTPTWPYAAALGGVGLVALAAGIALRGRRSGGRMRPVTSSTATSTGG